MKSRIQSKTALNVRRPTNLDAKTWKSIESIFKASHRAQRATGRFKFYPYLVAVYRTCKEWKRPRSFKKDVAPRRKAFKTSRRKSTSPVRTLIDATFLLWTEAKKPMVTGSGIRSFHQSDARTASKSFQE